MKAYDTVDWDFLFNTIVVMEIPEQLLHPLW